MVCKSPKKRLDVSLVSGKGQKTRKELEQLHYAALLNKTVDMLQRYTPAAHTVETFAEEQLKNAKPEDAAFVSETFYGVLRNSPFLKRTAEALVRRRTTGTQKTEQWLYMVITFLLVFKIEELGYHAFAGFVRSCPALPMYLLLEFLFDTKALSTAARAEWLRHYDMDYIDNVILSRLQKLTGPFSNLLESLRVLSTASAVGPITGQPDPKALDPNEFTGKAESGRVSHLLETSGYTAQAKTPSSTDAAQHLPVAGTTPDVLGLRPKLLKEGPTGISPLANPPPPSLNKYAVHLGVSDGIRQLCSEVARLAGQKQKELGHEGKGAVQEGVGRVQDTSRRADVDPRQTPDKPDKPAREGTAKGAGSLREAEKEDEEEDEDEDLWMKDIDGEETFLGRKADRQRKKRAHEEKAFAQWTMQRPSTLPRLVQEEEDRFKAECTFKPCRPKSLPAFAKAEAQVKLTTAEVLRAAALLSKRQEEEYALRKQYEIDKRDSRSFTEWQRKERMKQEEQRVENVAIKRAEAQLARAQGIHAAAVLKLKRANLVQGFRELAKEHRLLRLKQKAEEQAKLVERAHASRELRDKPIEAVKQATDDRRQQAAAEKVQRRQAQLQAAKLVEEEQARKYSIVVQMRGLEKAAVSARHLRSRVGQRDDWGEAQAPASTLTAMPFGEVKARLELQKAREVEKLRRKRMAIAEESTQRKQEVLAKAEELARYRHEAAATAERRRMEKLVAEEEEWHQQLARHEATVLQEREKILGKKRQQKAERQRLANELRTQQIKNEFLHSTKLNVEKQVREQQMRGAERRAARQAADDIKKESLTEGIRRREQYQRMANKAAAEVLEASGNAERAQLLCGLEQQKNELEHHTQEVIAAAAAARREEERILSAKLEDTLRQRGHPPRSATGS